MATKVIGINCGFSAQVIEVPFNDERGFFDGDEIIYQDEDGKEEYGVIAFINRETSDKERISFQSKILRKASSNDLQKVERCTDDAKKALRKCRELVAKYGLEMQVFQCGYSFSGEKIGFIFTSEDRVDFRELVKELAKTFKKQIYLKQIGPRDKAKIIGGYGRCGRPLCCNTFLGKLESINMEMVRIQGLEGKGASKLSGVCGKLLCCLKYEMEAYRELKKSLPQIGMRVSLKPSGDLPKKEGQVIGLDILNQKLKLFFENEYFVASASDVDKILK